MRLSGLRRDAREFRAGNLNALLFKPADNLSDQPTLDGVGLENDECAFHSFSLLKFWAWKYIRSPKQCHLVLVKASIWVAAV
jgi:hypothetical protein